MCCGIQHRLRDPKWGTERPRQLVADAEGARFPAGSVRAVQGPKTQVRLYRMQKCGIRNPDREREMKRGDTEKKLCGLQNRLNR